jgi:mRNA-degrading endonuclease RelE of RelBE toxin-antitoxin system
MPTESPLEGPIVEVIASSEFERRLKALAKRYRRVRKDLQPIFESLAAGIFPGDQVPGTNYTVLKLRIKNSVRKRGKAAVIV